MFLLTKLTNLLKRWTLFLLKKHLEPILYCNTMNILDSINAHFLFVFNICTFFYNLKGLFNLS